MSKEGNIQLRIMSGEIIIVRHYTSVSERKKILKVWEHVYSRRFKNCMIQIAPAVDERQVLENGENNKLKRA